MNITTIHRTLLICLIISIPVRAKDAPFLESWASHYNSDCEGKAIEVDNMGNVYIAGTSSYYDYITIKYNSEGIQQWAVNYDSGDDDETTDIAIDDSGYIYITGFSGTGINRDIVTIKYDSTGSEQWIAQFNGSANDMDQGGSIAVDPSGNVYVAGSTGGISTDYDYIIIKYNSSGIELWNYQYDGPDNDFDFPHDLFVDDIGNVYATGYSRGVTSDTDFCTLKLDPYGSALWVKRYNGSGNGFDSSSSLILDSAGNVYVAGSSEGDSTGTDFVTIKYNNSGVEQWVRIFNDEGISNDWATDISVDTTGNIYVTGSTGLSAKYDYVTIKYDSDGNTIWLSKYEGSDNENATGITVDSKGNAYVTGTTGSYAFLTVKYGPTGKQEWECKFRKLPTGECKVHGITSDNIGNVYITGYSIVSGMRVSSTIRYTQPYYLDTPEIRNIEDVPGDHGLQINLEWTASIFETAYPQTNITGYTVWRKDSNWTNIMTVAAQNLPVYSSVVPTLCDSTEEGIYWSNFIITANTNNENEYYCSKMDSAYSIDNIPPNEPGSPDIIFLDPCVQLTWSPAADSDLLNYEIYKSQTQGFEPSVNNLITTITDTVLNDCVIIVNTDVYYIIASVDDAKNRTYSDELKIHVMIPPSAETMAATDILISGATLNGTVNAQNASSTVSFEYGLDTNYGMEVPADQSPVVGNTDTDVSKILTGLNSNITYHYRIKAINSAGTAYGSDKTFICEDVPLSVQLVSFSASVKNGSIVLSWATESELGNTGFILERSVENSDLLEIASYKTHPSLTGKGNQSNQSEYIFTDRAVEPNKNYYYYLSDVSVDGSVNSHPAIHIKTDPVPEKTDISIPYPNPFNPKTYIGYNLQEDTQVEISVYDILGREIVKLVDTHQSAGRYHAYWYGLDTIQKRVPSGIYIIQMKTENMIQTQRVQLLK